MQLYSGDGILVTQNIDELEIDFDSSRYSLNPEEAENQVKEVVCGGKKLDWNMDFLNLGHIRSYFSTRTLGPTLAKESAMEMVDYIKGCAIAGP